MVLQTGIEPASVRLELTARPLSFWSVKILVAFCLRSMYTFFKTDVKRT